MDLLFQPFPFPLLCTYMYLIVLVLVSPENLVYNDESRVVYYRFLLRLQRNQGGELPIQTVKVGSNSVSVSHVNVLLCRYFLCKNYM